MASVNVPLSLCLLLLLAGLKTSFAKKKPVVVFLEDCSKDGDVTFKDLTLHKNGLSGTVVVKKPITEETIWSTEVIINGEPHPAIAVEAENGEWDVEKDPFFQALGLPSQPPIKEGEYKFSHFKTDLAKTPLCKEGREFTKATIKEIFEEDVSGELCITLDVHCK